MDATFEPENYYWPWRWEDVFGRVAPVHVDIGCGDGGFLCQAAAAMPEQNFFGIERLLGRVRKIARRAAREKLAYVRVLRLENAYTVRYLMAPESVDVFHLYHPDPFPKKKQQKRRLVRPEFAESIHKALKPNGLMLIRTDHAEYFEVMAEVFRNHGGFVERETPEVFQRIQTDFEREYRDKGQAIYFAGFGKKG